MQLGTLHTAGFYSLGACECFGEAHADAAPVSADSNGAVPRGAGAFNAFHMPAQQIFQGPYSCEASAEIKRVYGLASPDDCQPRCEAEKQCKFYQVTTDGNGVRALFRRFDHIGETGIP